MEMRVVKEIAQTHGKSSPYLRIHFNYASNLCATGNAILQAHDLLAVTSLLRGCGFKIRELARSGWNCRLESKIR